MKNKHSNQEPRPMDKQALVDSIAYCGLVCGRCHLRAESVTGPNGSTV